MILIFSRHPNPTVIFPTATVGTLLLLNIVRHNPIDSRCTNVDNTKPQHVQARSQKFYEGGGNKHRATTFKHLQ